MTQIIFWLSIATLIFIAINRHLYACSLEDKLDEKQCQIKEMEREILHATEKRNSWERKYNRSKRVLIFRENHEKRKQSLRN